MNPINLRVSRLHQEWLVIDPLARKICGGGDIIEIDKLEKGLVYKQAT